MNKNHGKNPLDVILNEKENEHDVLLEEILKKINKDIDRILKGEKDLQEAEEDKEEEEPQLALV